MSGLAMSSIEGLEAHAQLEHTELLGSDSGTL